MTLGTPTSQELEPTGRALKGLAAMWAMSSSSSSAVDFALGRAEAREVKVGDLGRVGAEAAEEEAWEEPVDLKADWEGGGKARRERYVRRV